MITDVGERTPLHPGAVHVHETEDMITMYDGDFFDSTSNSPADLRTYTGHICYCGVMYLLEPN